MFCDSQRGKLATCRIGRHVPVALDWIKMVHRLQ